MKYALTDLDLAARESYMDQMLAIKEEEVVLICVDETPISFGGSNDCQHVLAPQGVIVYASRADPRFSKMQWAAACADTRIRRPHYVWTPETNELKLSLARKLEAANDRARKEVERQLAASEVAGSSEHYLLSQAQAQGDE